MTSEDSDKLVAATYAALKSEFGIMSDLPYELANTVANIYFRYFQTALDSAPVVLQEELVTRRCEYESISGAIAELRLLPSKGADQSLIDILASVYLDAFKYRIPDVATKTPIRRAFERKFRKSQDIPDLVRSFQLYP